MNDQLKTLFNILYEKSFMYREDPPFKLASGKESNYYFDCKAATLDHRGVAIVGKAVFHRIREIMKDTRIDAVGGLTLGADPISISTAIEANNCGVTIYPIIVRKEPKGHGTGKWIEGDVDNVRNVVVIDDVITTGGSTIEAIERIRESGLNVVKAVVLIDREEGGRENIEKCGVEVISIFRRSDFDRIRLRNNK